jgi:hypothetical protein
MTTKDNNQNGMPHNGNLVYNKVAELQLSNVAIGSAIGRSSVTVGAYFKEPSLHSRILWQLSKAMNYNFLKHLADCFDNGEAMQKTISQAAQIANLTQQIEEQKLRIRDLETTVAAYKDVLKK